MGDLVPFMQYKKREKQPWRSVTFSSKSNTPPWLFFTSLDCTNSTKSCKTSHISFIVFLNPFLANVPIEKGQQPLKTPENL